LHDFYATSNNTSSMKWSISKLNTVVQPMNVYLPLINIMWL